MELDKKLILLLALCFSTFGCETTFNDKAELIQYIGDKDNGLIIENRANDFILKMKYLPPEYLALNELNTAAGISSEEYHFYLNQFKDSKTFLLTIEPIRTQSDASEYKINNLQEYNHRIENLNFQIRDKIYLQMDNGSKIEPVLSLLENKYELDQSNSLYLVFADNDMNNSNSDYLDIVFHDDFLDTGISHFKFEKETLDNLPELIFEN